MVDWQQTHISLEVGCSGKRRRERMAKADGIKRQNSVEKQGICGIKLYCPTEPVVTNVTGNRPTEPGN